MARFNEIDRQVLAALPGRDKLKALLSARGLGLKDFAQKRGLWVQEVSICLRGERPLSEIRDALADELGIDRAVVDELIDGPTTPAAKVI